MVYIASMSVYSLLKRSNAACPEKSNFACFSCLDNFQHLSNTKHRNSQVFHRLLCFVSFRFIRKLFIISTTFLS